MHRRMHRSFARALERRKHARSHGALARHALGARVAPRGVAIDAIGHGQHLGEFPLTMCGVDFNSDSLAETKSRGCGRALSPSTRRSSLREAIVKNQ